MNPRGPIPHAAVALSESVLSAHCTADALRTGLAHLMQDLVDAWADREVNYHEARHLADHMKRLHGEAGVLCRLLERIRGFTNQLLGLVSLLRGRLQETKKQGGMT